MVRTIGLLLASSSLLAAGSSQTLTGVVGDDMCNGDHAAMHSTDAVKCTTQCVQSMHAKYALWLGKDVYILSDQKAAAKFAGKTVAVTGEVNGKDIAVKSIKAAK